ncbi:helicase-associated domain-containing protein [Leucobacter chromiireducens]|uniref:helicase-associated domain-containing protein n=1 Tax=Leucobacter chromiireducens TaxID=283877 RepID=UPI000F63955C|nr:helicase-associated domain-containing protein [Leucobacter chromiireducens]
MSGTLALASALAEMDRDALHALVAARRPYAAASITDPIGLAAELLRADSIQRAVHRLDRAAITTLLRLDRDPGAVPPTELAALTSLGLTGVDLAAPVPLPEVTEAISAALAEAGVPLTALADPEPEPHGGDAPAGDTDTAAQAGDAAATWYSPALTAVGEAAEVLRALTARPGKLNRNGTVAVASIRQLSEHTGIDVTAVAHVLSALRTAALTAEQPDAQLLTTSAQAPEWLALDHRARWERLAAALLAEMPRELRRTLAETPGDLAAAEARIPHRFPLLPAQDRAAARSYTEVVEHLGCTVQGTLSPPAAALLAGERAVAAARIARDTPDVAPGVYVQPDLSVVIPGPLPPSDEALLAAFSHPEQIGVASTRRISDLSLGEALEHGITPADVRAAVSRLSLTGVPQPLEYLLSHRAERAGDLIVHEHHGDEGRTRLAVARPELAETLLVDRALQHLQLMRGIPTADGAAQLFSRLRPEHVLSALTDARYQPGSALAPATASAAATAERAHTRDASAATLDRTPTEAVPVVGGEEAVPPLTEALTALVDRVHTAARAEPGTSEFTRRLELAMRDKRPVRVTAEARGRTHEFTLLPVSVSGGRLRATDQLAGVERTLPVSMITAVEAE